VRFIVLFFAALFLSAAPALADPADIAATARSVVRVVLISDDGDNAQMIGHGSGLAVTSNIIMTNAHVVAQARDNPAVRIGVVPSQGKSGWFARIIAVSPKNDLALIQLTEKGSLPPVTLNTGAVEDGSEVFAVGYPGNVDLAQGLSIGDIVSPTSPVKTHGYVSSGRTSKQFDTILHTAPIGAGNSGGPLLDACGRVIGVNSFGTLSGEGDSEFYFAVSMREAMRFLVAAGIKPQINGEPCRSIADLDRAEADRLAGEKLLTEEQQRAADAKRDLAERTAERQAQREVIGARENGMALAGVAVLLALVAGGLAFIWSSKPEKKNQVKAAAILAVLLVIGAVIAWLMRPSLDAIEERAQEIAAKAEPSAVPSPTTSAGDGAGAMVCVLDAGRSRVTVSPVTDVPIDWKADGCMNTRSQYGLGADGWSRVLVPDDEDAVTVAAFDPASRVYRTDRYLLDLDTMTKLRAERAKVEAPACGAGEAAARTLGDAQAELKALLPPVPNERMVYNCQATK
jgi:V8-like Glu-specific endopeptidase